MFILLEWEDRDQARRFIQSEDLKEKMREGGVTDRPDIFFLDKADGPSTRSR